MKHTTHSAPSVHVLLAWLALGLSGCAESSDAASSQSAQADDAECPAEANECPASCSTLRALRFDHERACVEPAATVFGCSAPLVDQSLDAACFRRVRDDSLWLGSSSAFPRPAFERCDEASNERVHASDLCD